VVRFETDAVLCKLQPRNLRVPLPVQHELPLAIYVEQPIKAKGAAEANAKAEAKSAAGNPQCEKVQRRAASPIRNIHDFLGYRKGQRR
jgi:hypothetical protein